MRCRFCDAVLTQTFADLGETPLANAYVQPDAVDEPVYPLHAKVCGDCYLVQLPEVASAEDIFGDYAYFSSYSTTWLDHARRFAEDASARFDLDAGSLVVEIASNDGYLLQYFAAAGIPVLGIEPAANVAKAALAAGVPTEIAFFGEELARRLAESGIRPTLVVGNNVLAHVPDINDFVAGLAVLLGEAGALAVEFPHLLNLIAETQFDTIYHEHFSYLSLLTVERIFRHHGLAVFDVEQIPTHGGSLRVFATAASADASTTPAVAHVRELERQAALDDLTTYAGFAERVDRSKAQLTAFLAEAEAAGRSVAAYGAAAKGNTLLNTVGADTSVIEYVVDRNPHKQGLLLPGSRLPIMHPDHIRTTKPDYVLILPWNLKDEIIDQMADVREWGGQFVVAIPETTVLS